MPQVAWLKHLAVRKLVFTLRGRSHMEVIHVINIKHFFLFLYLFTYFLLHFVSATYDAPDEPDVDHDQPTGMSTLSAPSMPRGST